MECVPFHTSYTNETLEENTYWRSQTPCETRYIDLLRHKLKCISVKPVKAQTLSWIWAFIVAVLGLITTAWIYIVYNDTIKILDVSALNNGANPDHIALLNTFWAWAPVAALIGFGIFVIIMSITTRGGDQYVP